MKGIVTGCGEIGNERKIQVYIEGSIGYFTDNFGLERLDSFNIGGLSLELKFCFHIIIV
jgi:hypothetical protein